MQYRTFNKTGEKVSLLGFGSMRLPTLEGGAVDEAEAIRMIRHAIDSGVNYVDTAYMYHDGLSEVIVGRALKDGYRERVFLADKMPPHFLKKPGDVEMIFETQMERLDTDVIDFYLVHNVFEGTMANIRDYKIYDFVARMKEEGRVKHLGFSYHGMTTELFKEVIDSFDWDFCQIQLNYMDAQIQAGVAGLKYAGSKGIPVVIMEPLKGGKITQNIPPQIQSIWDGFSVKRPPAEWALRWVADFPEVLTILSGMSTMEQVEENLRILSEAGAGQVTGEERAVISRVADKYNELIRFGCTACGYCLPECPQKIIIPEIINMLNEVALYDCVASVRDDLTYQKVQPDACIACGACTDICPQHLPVPDIMKECAEKYGTKKTQQGAQQGDEK
jgi:predicted aldo/keto reductase-like oxidoreductase